jgi:hypothetical protein
VAIGLLLKLEEAILRSRIQNIAWAGVQIQTLAVDIRLQISDKLQTSNKLQISDRSPTPGQSPEMHSRQKDTPNGKGKDKRQQICQSVSIKINKCTDAWMHVHYA